MNLPLGRLHVGHFGGVHQVHKGTGEKVEGLFEVKVVIPARSEDDDPQVLRSSFFATRGGSGANAERARIAVQFEELGLAEGDPVCVRVIQQVRNGYTNDKAVQVMRLPEAASESRRPRAVATATA